LSEMQRLTHTETIFHVIIKEKTNRIKNMEKRRVKMKSELENWKA
jgi:hypothetical protein